MSEVNFVDKWEDQSTQCQNCKSFQRKDGQTACVPEDKNFEQALAEYGTCPENAHCDFFEAK